jgi:hypothetical protein
MSRYLPAATGMSQFALRVVMCRNSEISTEQLTAIGKLDWVGVRKDANRPANGAQKPVPIQGWKTRRSYELGFAPKRD